MSKRQKLIDTYLGAEEELQFLSEHHDNAIVGAAQRADGMFVVCYSEPKIIKFLMERDDMEYEEALEYFQFNILGAWLGENTPVFVDDEVLNEV